MKVRSKRRAQNQIDALCTEIARYSELGVAISGGVDSTTLAAVAHTTLGNKATMLHAVSPAVQPEASDRVRHYAKRFGWKLKIINAGEFEDDRYRANPVNRCYYCKSSLYTSIGTIFRGVTASGANLDDLGDYRPGLRAASENRVVHPLIDAGIDKAGVRDIAASLGLEKVADLPAQPCLSSRVETGIAIHPDDLVFVHRVERYLTQALGEGDIRCRLSHAGVRVELPESVMQENVPNWSSINEVVEQMIAGSDRRFVSYSFYKRGSAFLHE